MSLSHTERLTDARLEQLAANYLDKAEAYAFVRRAFPGCGTFARILEAETESVSPEDFLYSLDRFVKQA